MQMQRKTRFNFGFVILATVGVLLAHDLFVRWQGVRTIPYSEFQKLLDEGKVDDVLISSDRVSGSLKASEGESQRFVTTRVDEGLAEELREKGVRFQGVVESGLLLTLASWIVPALVFVGLWVVLSRRMGGGSGFMAIGKSKARVYVETDTRTRFSDVAGVDEAVHELREVVQFLQDPAKHGRLGGRLPKGVLLVGPPGTGKTLIARAVAGEAGVPFFSISGSEFVEMFVGVGAARVRDLFEQARAKAPCIIFIDELDALGRARNAQTGFGGHDEKEQTLNQLLVELDGFDPRSGIVLLAATNRPEVLDAALLRAGRFDRQVLIDRPDRRGRVQILGVHLAKIRAAAEIDAEKIAALTPGFTGADLANLVNEAALVATRRNAAEVTLADFTVAVERIVAGLEKRNRILSPREREIVAHHELGHAIAAAALPGCDPVHKISIIPRGLGALGYTLQRPADERYLLTREDLEARLTVLLGGRAAEHIIFGHLSTGAADDLARATDLARSMVTRFAMVPELGHVTYADEPAGFLGPLPPALRARSYSEGVAREIDAAVRALVDQAFERARALLEHNRTVLVEGARLLLEKETLEDAELAEVLGAVERAQ